MKLDKIKFARLIAYIAGIKDRGTIDDTDIDVLDVLIDIDVEPVKTDKVSAANKQGSTLIFK